MDILTKISASTRIVVAVGLLLVAALVVVTIQRTPPGKAATVSQLPVGSTSPEPSKENVSKQVHKRIEHLKDVVTANPSDARSAIELARTLQDGHDLGGALRYYEMGLRVDPKNLDARVDYSLCLYQSGRGEEAFAQNVIVLQQDASNVHALFNLGAIYGNKGMTDSAAYYWKKLVAFHPHNDLAQKAEQNLKQLVDEKPTL